MSHELVPDDVQEFIRRHIDSVGQLEALLLLRANPDRTWDAATVARRLYAPTEEIHRALVQLSADGFLVAEDGGYRYQCPDQEQQRVDRLVQAYSRQLIPITNLIHEKPRGIREFSDAFKFKKDR